MNKILHRLSKNLFNFMAATIVSLSLADESTKPRFLSLDELRACRKVDAKLKEQEAPFDKTRAELAAEIESFPSEATALAAALEALSKKQTEAELAVYNKRVSEHNIRVEAHRKRTLEFNVAINDFNSARAANMKLCATRPFKLEDEEALKLEQEHK